MKPIDKQINKDVTKGRIPKPIEDLPLERAEEDREEENREPTLGELDEDPDEM